MPFFEISSKTNFNVREAMYAGVTAVLDKVYAAEAKTEQKIVPKQDNVIPESKMSERERDAQQANNELAALAKEIEKASDQLDPPPGSEISIEDLAIDLLTAYRTLAKVSISLDKLDENKLYTDHKLYDEVNRKRDVLRMHCIKDSNKFAAKKRLPRAFYYDYITMNAEAHYQQIQQLATKVMDAKFSLAAKLPGIKNLKALYDMDSHLLATFPKSFIFSSSNEKKALATLTGHHQWEENLLLSCTHLIEEEVSIFETLIRNENDKEEKKSDAFLSELPAKAKILKNCLDLLEPPFILKNQQKIFESVKKGLNSFSSMFIHQLHRVEKTLGIQEKLIQNLVRNDREEKIVDILNVHQDLTKQAIYLKNCAEFFSLPLAGAQQKISTLLSILYANHFDLLTKINEYLAGLTIDLVAKEEDELQAEQEVEKEQSPEEQKVMIEKAKGKKDLIKQINCQLDDFNEALSQIGSIPMQQPMEAKQKGIFKPQITEQRQQIVTSLGKLDEDITLREANLHSFVTMRDRKKQNLTAFNKEKEKKPIDADSNEIPNDFICALTQEVMLDPYILPVEDKKGVSYSYEKQALLQLDEKHALLQEEVNQFNPYNKKPLKDPRSRQALLGSAKDTMIRDVALRKAIQEFYSQRPHLLPEFIDAHLDKSLDVLFDWINTLPTPKLEIKAGLFQRIIEGIQFDAIKPLLIRKKADALERSVKGQRMSVAEGQLTLNTLKHLLEKIKDGRDPNIKPLMEHITRIQSRFDILSSLTDQKQNPSEEKLLTDEELMKDYIHDQDTEEDPDEFICPFTQDLMDDPVYLDEERFQDKTRYEYKELITQLEVRGRNINNVPVFGLQKGKNDEAILPTPKQMAEIFEKGLVKRGADGKAIETGLLKRDDRLREKIKVYREEKQAKEAKIKEKQEKAKEKLPLLKLINVLTLFSKKAAEKNNENARGEFNQIVYVLRKNLDQPGEDFNNYIKELERALYHKSSVWVQALSLVEVHQLLDLVITMRKNYVGALAQHPAAFFGPEVKLDAEQGVSYIQTLKLMDDVLGKLKKLDSEQKKAPFSLKRAINSLEEDLQIGSLKELVEAAALLNNDLHAGPFASSWVKIMDIQTRDEVETLLVQALRISSGSLVERAPVLELLPRVDRR